MISSLELAKICGVAQATVDRAIHNRPGISAKTRQRILREAAKHGYRANPLANELLRGDSRIVGAIMPMLRQVFFTDLMGALAAELAERDQRLFIAPAGDEREFFDAVHEFAARRVKAMVVIPPAPGLTLDEKQTGGAPVVSLINPCGKHATFIAPDERRTGADAVQYLMRHGHRRIVHVTYQRSSHAINERAAGYLAEMKRERCEAMVLRGPDDAAIVEAMREGRPTAWFCHNDWLAVRVIGVLQAAGVRVPDEASVLGVDDSPTLRDVWPALSTMRYPMTGVAKRTAAVLGGERSLPEIEAMQIVERGTVTRAIGMKA